MSLSDLASLGSFASGIAVIISLISLSLQMRQNTRVMIRAEANAAQDQMSNWRLALANSADLTAIWVKGGQDEDLSDLEESRCSFLLQDLIFGVYQVWDRANNAMGDSDDWNRIGPGIATLLITRRGAAWWQQNRYLFWPNYVAAMDAAMRDAQASERRFIWPTHRNAAVDASA